MSTIKLKATKREESGKQVSALRKKGLIPAVSYGHNVQNKNLTLNLNEFNKVFASAGFSTLVDLEIEGGEMTTVVITDYQRDPVLHNFTHVDFKEVNLKEEMVVDVAIKFIGESPAVKTGCSIITVLDSVEVKCLPADLPHEFIVDLSTLAKAEDHIAIKDLVVPAKVKITNDPADFIVIVKALKVEAEPVIVAPVVEAPKAGTEPAKTDKTAEVKKVDSKK
jgi:large subunit ribosomal protein L25